MSVYKCKCGYADDETTKCPKCGGVTVYCKDSPPKKKAKAKTSKK